MTAAGTPGSAPTRVCSTCGQDKPLTDYAHPRHRSCSRCNNWTHGLSAHALRQACDAVGRSVAPPPPAPHWVGAESRPFTGRPEAMDAFALPSRMGQRLHYRDGRVEPLQGTAA